MSDPSFVPPLIPPMSPERARNVALSYKALADHLAAEGVRGEAAYAERQSNWWLAYSTSLAVKPSDPPSSAA